MIIILPGVGGSVLHHSGVGPLWDPSLGHAGALLRADSRRIDLLAEDPGLLDDHSHRGPVTAVGLIQRETTLPGLAAINMYQPLCQALLGNLEVKVGNPRVDGPPANYFEFAYDWRRDIRVPAECLQQLVTRELSKWSDVLSPGTSPQTVLIAHSMGGLVAKYYLDVLGGWRTCRALITFGTPYRGAPVAADYLANGFQKFGVSFAGLNQLIATFTSVHQLLPRYPIVEDRRPGQGGNAPLLRVAELPSDVGNLRTRRAEDARSNFHKALGTPSPGEWDKKWIPLGGFGHRTVQSVVFDGRRLKASSKLPSAERLGIEDLLRDTLHGGDGTVPALSATPVEWAKFGIWDWENGKHSSIHRMTDVLEKLVRTLVTMSRDTSHLERALGGGEAVEGASLAPPPQPSLDLEVDPVFLADEPIEGVCGLAGVDAADPATVEISGGTVLRRLTVDAGGDGYRWSAGLLPTGGYTVTVRVPSVGLSVSEVFEVC
jgi:hypothetical protein